MQVEKISCNSCGAPLEVAATTQFATCRHGRANLSIQRTETATFTEVLEQLAVKTDQLSEQVQNLTGHTELAALDREWQMDRENDVLSSDIVGAERRFRTVRGHATAESKRSIPTILLVRCIGSPMPVHR